MKKVNQKIEEKRHKYGKQLKKYTIGAENNDTRQYNVQIM